ncbi:NADH:ubiquinone oxidoreductase subunit NDUFA12 [Rhizobiaceae bacterium]|nr:NADH:ubiquinone oxidoreductase subunit NDUFA12 [Rhizobiaceae bacterium]
MKAFFLQFFTWWHTNTLATRFFTWRNGDKVGTDETGNTYYRSEENRRWIIYNGAVDPTRIPAGWHGWLHFRTDIAPSDEAYAARDWELPHKANLTGTMGAYRPKGALSNQTKTPDVAADYEAWSP